MKQQKFEVYTSSKGDNIYGIIYLLVSSVGFFVFMKYTAGYPFAYRAIYIVALFMGYVIIIYSSIADRLWRIKVEGNQIDVRTSFGRRYSFTVADIVKVISAFRHNYRADYYPVIEISTKTKKLEISAGKKGFVSMIEYLLEKSEIGEINPTAISVSCRKKLTEYSNDKIYRKIN